MLSSNVKLLAGRNVRLGRPGVFVKSGGRLVAVGGTRAVDRPIKKIEIVRAPRLHSTKKVGKDRNLNLNQVTQNFLGFLALILTLTRVQGGSAP